MNLMQGPPGAKTQINGLEFDYFCGTSYFALHGHPALITAACEATQQYGLGLATSRAGVSDSPVLVDVEAKAAQFFNTEAAHYYPSGYLGTALLLKGLAADYEMIFVDSESHYSVLDGIAVSGKPWVSFAHGDAEALQQSLHKTIKPGQRPLVITDGLFPTSGEIAPLRDYHQVLAPYDQALLCVDDAHAMGVLGDKGQGTLEYFGIQGEGRYSSGTLSKAFGGHGGIIAGSQQLIEQVKLTSANPPSIGVAAASAKGLEILMAKPQLRQQLWDNAHYAKAAFRALGFADIPDTPVPIICLSGAGIDLATLQQKLFKQGIAVLHVPGGSYTSVPASGALKITIFSTHSRAQIDRLVGAVSQLL